MFEFVLYSPEFNPALKYQVLLIYALRRHFKHPVHKNEKTLIYK